MSPSSDLKYSILVNRRTATWNLFVTYPLSLWGKKWFKRNITWLRIPTDRRQASCLVYKRGREFELSTTEKKSKTVARAGLEIWAPALQPLVQPRWLLTLCLLHRSCNCMLGITKGWRHKQPKIKDRWGFFCFSPLLLPLQQFLLLLLLSLNHLNFRTWPS